MNRCCLLAIAAACLLVSSVATAGEYKDSQLFPFSMPEDKKTEVQQAGWLPKVALKNPIQPVSHTFKSSWNAVTRTGSKAIRTTSRVLTPPKSLLPKLPKLNMPSLPKPNFKFPNWNREPDPEKIESVGDWLKLPPALPE